MSLRTFTAAATISLAAFAVAAQAAHHHRTPHRKDHTRGKHAHHRIRSAHQLARDSAEDVAWRAGGAWKEDPWLTHDERAWLDSGGQWHATHDRYWRPKFERRHYAAHGRIFAMLRSHGFRRFEGPPFWYHGHYLVRTFHGRYIDLVEVNPYTNRYLGKMA